MFIFKKKKTTIGQKQGAKIRAAGSGAVQMSFSGMWDRDWVTAYEHFSHVLAGLCGGWTFVTVTFRPFSPQMSPGRQEEATGIGAMQGVSWICLSHFVPHRVCVQVRIGVGGVFVAHNGPKGRVHDEPFSSCLFVKSVRKKKIMGWEFASMWVYVSWWYTMVLIVSCWKAVVAQCQSNWCRRLTATWERKPKTLLSVSLLCLSQTGGKKMDETLMDLLMPTMCQTLLALEHYIRAVLQDLM